MYPDIEMHAKTMEGIYKGHNQLYMRLRSCPMEHKQNLFSEVALARREYNYLACKKGIIIRWESAMRDIKLSRCHMATDQGRRGKRKNH